MAHLDPRTWWPIPFANLAASFIPGFKELTGVTTQSQRTGHPEELHQILRFGIEHAIGDWAVPAAWQPQGGPMGFHTLLEARRLEERRRLELRRLRQAATGVPAGGSGSLVAQRAAAVAGLAPPRFRVEGDPSTFVRQVTVGGAAAGTSAGVLGEGVVTRTWQTFPGGPVFTRFDGVGGTRISVTRKDGTIKVYRPYRPVVIPRKWNSRSMGRVATALKRQQKMAIKIVQLAGGEASASKRTRQPTHAQILAASSKH